MKKDRITKLFNNFLKKRWENNEQKVKVIEILDKYSFNESTKKFDVKDYVVVLEFSSGTSRQEMFDIIKLLEISFGFEILTN
jgi:Fic family protein